VATEVPGQANRIKVVRTDKFIKGTTNFRVLWKRLNYNRIEDADGNTFATRADAINYLTTTFNQSAAENVNASYLGIWNATTNNPTISGSSTANGSWYYVGVSGSVDPNDPAGNTGSVDYLVNDIVKFVSTSNAYEWQRIANETVRVDELDDTIDGIVTNSSLTQYDIHVDANYIGTEELGTAVYPYKTLQQAISASNSGSVTEVLLNGSFTVTSSLEIPGDKKIHFYGTEGTEVKYTSYNKLNGNIFTYSGTNYSGEIVFKNVEFKNAGGFALHVVSASKVEVVDCKFNYNGWSGNGINLTDVASGSNVGFNSPTSSLAAFYAAECSEGGALFVDKTAKLEFTDNTVNNNNKGLEIVDSGYVGTTNGYGYVSRNQIYNNVSIGIDLEASTGDAASGNKNFTLYNNNISNNGDTGVKLQGGLNNTLSLSTIKGNWNSAIELDAVGNTRVRDLDLDNNNRAGVDAEGDQASGLATIHITGSTLNSNATFIVDIFNTHILNTQLGSNSVKCGVILGSSVGNISGQNAIVKFDNLTFVNQDYALDFEANLDNLEVIVGECEYINTSIQSVRVQGTGKYLELPFKNFTTDIPYLDFSIDRVAKTISLKDGQNGKVINVYPINSIKSIIEGSRIDIIQTNSDKIQIRGLAEGRVYKEGDLISGSLNDVNNAINAAFTETTPTVLTPTTILATVSQSISTFETGSETGTSGSYFTGSNNGFNNGFVLTTDNALTSSGEFYTFTINTEGIIGMGFNKSGSTGVYASESIGTGTGEAENGYYWSTWFHPTPDGPWAYYGESAGNTALLSGWYNFDDSDSGADWLNGEDVTMRAGIDNDGYPYLSYYSANAGGYVPIARDGNTVPYDCELNLLIKFGDENAKVSNVMLHHTRDLTAQDLTYYAIESPDGVWYYPMFLTTTEANWFDSNLAQPIGAGTNEAYTFVDDTTGTTYYIPTSGSSTGSAVHPTGSYLSGSTFNYVVTENDDLYAPTAFSDATTTLNEGDSLNLQVIPAGYADTRTLVNPPSWISLSGDNAVGTAPKVLLDSTTVPSASYDVTVRTTNAYGFTDGTLTVKVLNTTTNTSLDGTIYQGTFLSQADYNSDYGTSLVLSDVDALIRTAPADENGAVYDLPYTLDDGDSYEWPFTRFIQIGIVSESVSKTGTDIVTKAGFKDRFDLLFPDWHQAAGGGSGVHSFGNPTSTDIQPVGWDNNTQRNFPGNPHTDTSVAGTPKDKFKLYNNAGRIELSYDINDGNGYQLFASSSTLHGTGSDAPTFTVVCPTSFTEDAIYLPTFTYTANGASAPNEFTLISGAMDTSLITVSESIASIDSIQINPGQRLVIDKEWAETNVLPYISEVADSSVLLGVSASGADWSEVSSADFDIAQRWSNEGLNSTRNRLFVTGSSAGTNNINSDTNGFYDHVIEFTREGNLFIGRTAESSNNAETLLPTDTWVNSGIINAWTASRGNENPITPILAGDDSRMRLSTTGLNVQRAPLPTRHYDVVEDTFGLPLFKRYNETDLAFGELSLEAGYVHKFWLHDSSIESTDALSFVSASDSTPITQGITSSGTPGTLGAYLEFNVPSDIRPIKTGWTTGGTLSTSSLNIVGSTYVEGVTGITLEGPAANQTGNNLFDAGDHGWASVDETLAAGQRLVMDNAFLIDLLDAMPDNSLVSIGTKNTGWTNTPLNYNDFLGNVRLTLIKYSNSSIQYYLHQGTSPTTTQYVTRASFESNGVEAFIEVTSTGNNVRGGIMNGTNTTNDATSTAYADWDTGLKRQTGAQGYGISTIDVMIQGVAQTNNTVGMDTADVDWTGLSEINIPQPAPTILTNWDKAVDFSGGNEHLLQVSTANNTNPLRMANLSVTVPANSDNSKTSDDTNSRPWATTIVFKVDGHNSNQHIWNSGEGTATGNDNLFLRLSSARDLYLGWGREGSGYNECEITTGGVLATNQWYGLYIAHKGARFNGTNATATNLANAFDIRLMSTADSWASVGSNLSTTSAWTSTGNRMDRSITGNFTIGGRGGNRNFHGKVASMVITTLRVDIAMPTDTEIEAMITDPKKWEDDYRDGNFVRWASTTSYSGYTPSNVNVGYGGTQIWLMGDGTSDSYANGIRNDVYPTDQNNTKLQFNNMASNDIETVNISGLT
jgi:hypothetical protein